MANNLYAGAMHWLGVGYEEDPCRIKPRPVLILHINNGKVYYFPITTVRGKPHQGKYRPKVIDWRLSGLNKTSYIKLKNPPSVAVVSDFLSDSYIGNISPRDANSVNIYMNRLGY